MYRAALEHAIDPRQIDQLFEREATTQYTHELLFSTTVEPMAAVVLGVRPSIRSAQVVASLTAVYEKLKGVETGVCRALLKHTTGRLQPLISQLHATLPGPVPGYRVKILDGNHLAGTEHRVPATRTTRGAALPGQALVVLVLAKMLVIDVIPCEDAHAQERALVGEVLPGVEPDDLWLADRNFCTSRLIFGILGGGGHFLIRQHKSTLCWTEATPWVEVGRVATGMVSEQTIRVTNPEGGQVVELSRIRLVLDTPTRGKDQELFLISDVPADRAAGGGLPAALATGKRLPNADRVAAL